MKKFSLCLCLLMVFSICACGMSPSNPVESSDQGVSDSQDTPDESTREPPAPAAGGFFPYDGTEFHFTGQEIEPYEDKTKQIVYVEISEKDFPMYQAFCDDGSGSYHPERGILFRVERAVSGGKYRDSYQNMSLQSHNGSIEEGKYNQQYTEWVNACPDGAKIVDHLISSKEECQFNISNIAAEAGDIFCVDFEEQSIQFVISGGADLSKIDEETLSFMEYIRDVYDSNNCSVVSGEKTAVIYFYQTRLFSKTVEENRFVYYSYLRHNGSEYIIQAAAPFSLGDSNQTALNNSPLPLNLKVPTQLESREVFLDSCEEIFPVILQ